MPIGVRFETDSIPQQGFRMKVPTKQAARLLEVPYSTLRGWLVASGVPTWRLGNYRLVDYDTARAIVAEKHAHVRTTGLSF